MSTMMKILLIAYGNPLRRDDGAGLALSERLKRQWQAQGAAIQHIVTQQLVPELVADIADAAASHIIFVDATAANFTAVDGAAFDSNAEIQLRPLDSEKAAITLGHQCSPDLLMYMAQHLYDVTVPAWLATIPGTDFGHGEGFSAGVEKLLEHAELVALPFLPPS